MKKLKKKNKVILYIHKEKNNKKEKILSLNEKNKKIKFTVKSHRIKIILYNLRYQFNKRRLELSKLRNKIEYVKQKDLLTQMQLLKMLNKESKKRKEMTFELASWYIGEFSEKSILKWLETFIGL